MYGSVVIVGSFALPRDEENCKLSDFISSSAMLMPSMASFAFLVVEIESLTLSSWGANRRDRVLLLLRCGFVLGNSPRIFDGTVVGVENPETACHPQEIPVTMHSPKNKYLIIVGMWIFYFEMGDER